MPSEKPTDEKAKPVARDFTISSDATNGLSLCIRCSEYQLFSEDDLSESELEMFQRIEEVLNENASRILGE